MSEVTGTAENASFEEAVGQLEAIVSAMESGQLTLEESLRCFEQAISLSRRCAAQLETAERQIQILSAEGDLQLFTDASTSQETIDRDRKSLFTDPFA